MIYFEPMKSSFTRWMLLFITFLFFAEADAQDMYTPEATVRTFFKGLNAGDTALMASTFHTDMKLQVLGANGMVRHQESAIFLRNVASAPVGSLDERLGEFTVRTDAPLAQVSMPYSFYYQGKLLHSGTNFFTLAQQNGAYKVLHLIDTRKPAN